jgi:hypothetical protein
MIKLPTAVQMQIRIQMQPTLYQEIANIHETHFTLRQSETYLNRDQGPQHTAAIMSARQQCPFYVFPSLPFDSQD